MWIVRLALRRPYTVATLCFVIFLLGTLCLTRMRTDVLPTIDLPVVSVVWNYPGLSAEDMERRVVYITERSPLHERGAASSASSRSRWPASAS